AIDVGGAVVEVVDDADVVEPLGAEALGYGGHVLRLSEPAPVVVEADGAAVLLCQLCNGRDSRRGARQTLLLRITGGRRGRAVHPELRAPAVAAGHPRDFLVPR